MFQNSSRSLGILVSKVDVRLNRGSVGDLALEGECDRTWLVLAIATTRHCITSLDSHHAVTLPAVSITTIFVGILPCPTAPWKESHCISTLA